MTRLAVVKRSDCNPHKCQELCVKLCPINRMGKDCITIVDGKAQIDEKLCTGCGICSKRCPFGAISIINLPEELSQEPIHRYGKNGFALYRLPIPVFGKVVGVIGRNGIGKSTAIQILAGILKPNLGREEKVTYKEIIEYFKGTEAQVFFEKLDKGEIKVSYKPQNIELIPKNFKGKVRELLSKVDEKNKLKEVIEELELSELMDNEISTVSGGELQRIAIAATVLKNANLFIFDEPTSYLDVKQRLKISRYIRKLIESEDEKNAVIVIEHDLIVLDYLADNIHLLYGKPGVYGVVSQPKSARVGINVYLEGYLKEENVRFRDKKIKFEEKSAFISRKQKIPLTEWKNIKKKLGKFSLEAEEGMINKHELTGVLGENGIGKTSFAKILAGELKADEGELTETVSISYKPQYIEPGNSSVAEFLSEAISLYNNQLIKPLEITQLLSKNLDELSGGELQRVFIAKCLSKDAQLYIMDEPSAYLDVEQRLVISSIIKDFIEKKGASCMVVDHDLLFIDYLSENLIVLKGIPAIKGKVMGPYEMEEGMNLFLKDLNITFRRDPESYRPRANKPDSQMDRKQRSEGKLYYIS